MENIDHVALLSLIVALSAYVGAIRLTVLGRIAANPPPSNKKDLQCFLKLLTPADIFLVFSAITLFLKTFWMDMFSGLPPSWFAGAVIWSFFLGILTLALHHLVAWVKTLIA